MDPLTEHKTNPLNEAITITPNERDPATGSSARYRLSWRDNSKPGMAPMPGDNDGMVIRFHSGPIDKGPNGVTLEALLAIALDKLRGHQSGPRPSEFNDRAIGHIEEALQALSERTAERTERGVEGKREP